MVYVLVITFFKEESQFSVHQEYTIVIWVIIYKPWVFIVWSIRSKCDRPPVIVVLPKDPSYLTHIRVEMCRRLPISIRIPRNSCTHAFTSFGSCETLKMVQKTLQTKE